MAEGDRTPTKPRQFTLDGECVDLIKTVQGRLTPKPNQPDTIKWALELFEQHTRHLEQRSVEDRLAELRAGILGLAS